MVRNWQRNSLVALLALATLATSACTVLSRRYGEPIPATDALLQEGVTNVHQVVGELGPPSRMSALPDGFAMLYEYVDAKERQLGINLDFLGLDWFKFASGRGLAVQQALLLLFDDSGTLRAADFQDWREPVGKGLAFQIFFVAMPTVDSRHLWEPSEQFGWGRSLLEPLPVTLNAGQSVRSGAHGLELRGTPRSAGERSLEGEDRAKRRQR